MHALHGALRIRHGVTVARHGPRDADGGQQGLGLPDGGPRLWPRPGARRVGGRAGRRRPGEGPRAAPVELGGLLVVHPAGAGIGRDGAGAGQVSQRHQQRGQGRGGIRADAQNEDRRPAGADHRHPRAWPGGGPRHVPDDGVVLGSGRCIAKVGSAL
ncbi:hypothetical protein G6F57_019985 [Rhizopus arrhizus]|nr:hypothetical protein G6F57_019985 [Rhizopus arrhizus]